MRLSTLSAAFKTVELNGQNKQYQGVYTDGSKDIFGVTGQKRA
jgi:hypothetical protein